MRPIDTDNRFVRSEAGTVAVLWGMGLVVFFGFIALIFDIGRTAVTQSELQSFADHVALAAAGELNGEPDAITRAERAVDFLISDTQSFGEGGRALSGAVHAAAAFYTNIPASDTAPLTPFATTDPAVARYVEVTVTPRSVLTPFWEVLQTLLGDNAAQDEITVGARATAGSESLICDITPLFFCAPAGRDLTAPSEIGTMIKLRTGQSGALWGDGNFGFLDPDASVDVEGVCAAEVAKGRAQTTNCLVGAEITRTSCVRKLGLDLSPGQQTGITNAAFNYRFDIFKSSDPERDDPRFPPAPNVVSGLTPESDFCHKNNPTASTDTVPIPRDACFAAGTCDRFGPPGGEWGSLKPGYMAANHPGVSLPSVSSSDFDFPTGFELSTVAGTRFETYLQEIKRASTASHGRILGDATSTFPETGIAQCSNITPSANPFRRVVTAAIVDCNDPAVEIRGNNTGIPAIGFVNVFLTEPVGLDTYPGGNFDLWGEVIGDAGSGGSGAAEAGGIARVVVRLVR